MKIIPTDPLDFVRGLDADTIAKKISELEREAKALRVLLRSARARQSAEQRRARPANTVKGVRHA
ncbi:MAG TPA: hypothetical protein VE988_07405 [Gemmataceae bacterium]|nr:hypothetical protein [Gemmataceae bacterium]